MENIELPDVQNERALPSNFQLGDYCNLVITKTSEHFEESSILYHGRVIKIHFGPGKVTYDLEFIVTTDKVSKKRYVTRVHNVDSALCEPVDSTNISLTNKAFVAGRSKTSWGQFQKDHGLSQKRPLLNHFAKYLCQRIEQKLGVTTVEDLQALPDERILSVTMLGKMALQKLRNL